MRQPKPWFWKMRGAWYVTLHGKQIKLHENEKEANREFYRIMAAEGRTSDRLTRMSVAESCEAIIGVTAHSRPSTVRLYQDMLGPFAAHFRSKRLDQLTPDQCIRFVAGYQGTGYNGRGFGDSTRALMFRHIKTLFSWARDTGLIQLNPMARIPNPWKIKPRQRPMSEEEYLLVMGDRKLNDQFKEVLEIMWRTGARPGEVAKLSARHLDARRPIARFQPTEHKTGGKTGLQREVYFPDDLMERMRKYAEIRPNGPLLLNCRGKPWSQELISDTFGRVKRRLGLANDCVIYLARHSFITKLAESGVPLARVAKLSGHTNPETIMRNYYHPDMDAMIRDVAAIDIGEKDKLSKIREEVEVLRKKHRSAFKDSDISPNT